MKVRIKFAKYGTMKFIGHLDIMRYFQKAIRRAEVDIKYSEGFSPHQIMSFAAPLGVGIESTGEYLDVELNSMTSTADVKDALNRVMVEGMEILQVSVLPDTVKNAMASVAAAKYTIHHKEGNWPIEITKELVEGFYQQDSIPYTKETKKSVIELNLKEGIYEVNLEGNNLLSMTVDASSSGNIKPTMVFEKLCEYAGIVINENDYQITRVETYTNVSKEENVRELITLGDVGIE